MDLTEFDFDALSAHERYKLMIGSVVPRPIALVTTVDGQGRFNAAPFSFFGCLSADPPILALGIENRADGGFKDTAANIRDTEVFTVNMVSMGIAEAMHATAAPVPAEEDEIALSGLTAMPGTKVAAPWIREAPAAFECRRHVGLSLGKSREIILGRIVHAHFAPGAVDAGLHVDPGVMDAVARLGGSTCSTMRDRFEMRTPSAEEVMARKG